MRIFGLLNNHWGLFILTGAGNFPGGGKITLRPDKNGQGVSDIYQVPEFGVGGQQPRRLAAGTTHSNPRTSFI